MRRAEGEVDGRFVARSQFGIDELRRADHDILSAQLSNDGWFSDTYLTDLHFWTVKLRAVETRRDIAFNSNNGYTGLVNAAGQVILKEKSDEPFVKMVSVNKHDNFSLAAEYPFLFVYLCGLYIAAIYIMNLVNTKKEKLLQPAAQHYKKHK